MPVVEIEHLSFSYAGADVLDRVDLAIQEKEFIGICGPNGGGKTTLLLLMLGFLKPSTGNIRIYGSPPAQARHKMGWVPQTFHFDRHFPISVEEVVLGGRLSHLSWLGTFSTEDKRIASSSLEKVGMLKYLRAPFASLSGGQTQRVLIARALASSPRLLLLDEPTASVDYTAQVEIYHLLRSLKDEITIVMVTHDLHGAVEYVDRLLCVQKIVTPLSRAKVCEHFAIGLYHSPLWT